MNYFQLVFKQMRQRALSTWLTTLSILLGVALAVSILVLFRESKELFGQTDYGFDVLVGYTGSPLQLTLNTIYQMDKSPGNIPYEAYNRLTYGDLKSLVRLAVPTVVGDTYQGKYRIVGTFPTFFGFDMNGNLEPPEMVMNYRPNRHVEIAQGHVFAQNKFEAVIGSDLARLTDLRIGSVFQATHGMPLPNEKPDIHAEKWTVVGILAPTHTAIDRVVYIPLESFYTIAEHGVGLIAQQQIRAGDLPKAEKDADEDTVPPVVDGIQHFKNYDYNVNDKTIKITIPTDDWALSAILVQSRGGVAFQRLIYDLNKGLIPNVMAVNPADTMRQFFNTFLTPLRWLLLLICSLVTIVAAVGILVSIYNSVSLRLREIAILRALGATRTVVLSLICLEAGAIAVAGIVLGLIVGHGVCGILSYVFENTFGQPMKWYLVDGTEILYVIGVLVLAVLAGLVPAIKAYRAPVATNLVAA